MGAAMGSIAQTKPAPIPHHIIRVTMDRPPSKRVSPRIEDSRRYRREGRNGSFGGEGRGRGLPQEGRKQPAKRKEKRGPRTARPHTAKYERVKESCAPRMDRGEP